MKRGLLLAMMLSAFVISNAGAQIDRIECYGGFDESWNYWSLLDYYGYPLQNGDWVYPAWTGPDEEIDPPDINGCPTGDDLEIHAECNQIENGTFYFAVITWSEGLVDSMGNQRRPIPGDLIYCRIFDGIEGSIGPGNYYGDSDLHEVTGDFAEMFFNVFPGDPGGGHTDTPIAPTSVVTMLTACMPMDFALDQNYPNPFNPVTEIAYAIPRDVHVILKIYNVLGAEVATLVDDDQAAGFYTVGWDAEKLAGGVYFCRLNAGAFGKTIKMVLLK